MRAGGRTVAPPLVASTGSTSAGDERGAASKLAVSTGSTSAGGGEVAPTIPAGVGFPALVGVYAVCSTIAILAWLKYTVRTTKQQAMQHHASPIS